MKTNLLFAAAFLITGTAFSQSVSSRNEASSSTSASASSGRTQASSAGSLTSSSSASSNANLAGKAEAASQATSGVKESAGASVKATKTEVKNDYQEVRQEAEADHRTSARVQAGSHSNVETKHNKAGSNTSIDTRVNGSTRSTLETGTMKMTKAEARSKKAADAAISSGNSLKSKTKPKVRSQAKTGSNVSVNGGAGTGGMKTGINSNFSGRSALSIK